MNMPHTKNMFWMPHLAGVCAFILVVFVGLVVYNTVFFDGRHYVIPDTEKSAVAWNGEHGLVVMYRRGFTITDAGGGMEGELQRVVRCPPDSGEQFFLDGDVVKRSFKAGYYPPAIRPVQFPAKLPIGTKCTMEVWTSWRPDFTWGYQRWMMDSIDFTVQVEP